MNDRHANVLPNKSPTTVGEDTHEEFLNFYRVASIAYDGIGERFKGDQKTYLEWLASQTEKSFGAIQGTTGVISALRAVGIDWLTLHYRSRHPRQPWETTGEWIQVGLPLAAYMAELRDAISAYSEGQSPYIESFSPYLSRSGRPLQIILGEEKRSDRYLAVPVGLADYLKEITTGPVRQGSLTPFEAERAITIDPLGVADICSSITTWTEQESAVDPEYALGLLRDVCRVTILSIRSAELLSPELIKFPRSVVLAPVAVGPNVIGGVAFIGPKEIPRFETGLLSLMAYSLLGGLRLREEERREITVQEVEQLSTVRARFVQLAAHSIHSPLDALSAHVDDATAWVKKVKDDAEELRQGAIETHKALAAMGEAVGRAKHSAAELILTFAKNDVRSYLQISKRPLNIRDFLETLLFFHERAFSKHGLKLATPCLPEPAIIWVDEAALFEVFNNLLSNALKFAASKVDVIVSREQQDGADFYLFRVRNDGLPIDPTISASLFQPGVHGESPYPERKLSSGQGFGLFLSKQVMERHGGEIALNREFKDGVEFELWLPIEQTEQEASQ